ncbi:MAG: phage tail fiber protein [Alphaproteobacteria bacterium]
MTNISRVQYIANGQNTEYQTPFCIYIQTGVEVYFDDIKIEPTNYSVALDKQTKATITFNTAPQEGVVITLNRVLPVIRTSSFQEGGALRASTLNYEFDYQMACLQDVSDELGRSMTYPPYATSTDVNLTLPSPEAGKSIVWTSDGLGLENSNIEVNSLEEVLRGYKEVAKSSATTAQDASETAVEKAEIATNKAAEVIEAVDNKASTDMDNISITGKAEVISWGMPDYDNGVTIFESSVPISEDYTPNENGYFYLKGEISGNATGSSSLSVGDLVLWSIDAGGAGVARSSTSYGEVRGYKGITYTFSLTSQASGYLIFVPLIGEV